jgi:hypothetical protein
MKPSDHRVLFNAGCNFLFAADYRPVEDRPGRLRWRYIRVTKSGASFINCCYAALASDDCRIVR